MAVVYPGSIPSFTSKVDGNIVTAAEWNDVTGETTAIALELGTLPKGSHADVKTRLDQLDLRGAINQLINGGQELWEENTTFTTPASGTYAGDQWKIIRDGTTPTFTVTKETGAANIDSGLASAKIDITVLGDLTNLTRAQLIENFEEFKGKVISISARVKCSVAGSVKVQVADGVATSEGSANVGTGFETLTHTFTVSTSATFLRIGVGLGLTGSTIAVSATFIDSVMMIIGGQAIDFIPTDPSRDLMGAQRHWEKSYRPGIFQGTAVGEGSQLIRLTGSIGNNALWGETTRMMTRKRSLPTITIFSTINASTSGVVTIAGTDRASDVVIVSESSFSTRNITGGAIGAAIDQFQYQWISDARL